MYERKEIYFLIGLVVLLFVVNYNFIDGFLEKNFLGPEIVQIERVIDGDTVVVNGSSMRLLGINTPERGEEGYNEAKEFLESLVLNKKIRVERYGQDKYYRELVYLFDPESKDNINLEIVEKGYGNYYFPEGKERYYEDFVLAWDECMNSGKNLCEKSKHYGCFENEFEGQKVTLKNVCNYEIDLSGWSVKDEGRKKFIFGYVVLDFGNEVEATEKDFGKDYVWTSTGDTLFLRDKENKLVLWGGY